VSELPRVGIVGCGVISRAYAAKLAALPFLELAACADLMSERARKLAEEHAIPHTPDVDALLADPELDVVVNLTVPAAHADVSRRALEAGKAVYSEKPLGLALDEGRALVECAEKHDLRLGCAPDTFLGAGLQTCRRLIDEGAIGEPVAANAFMLSPGPESWHPGPDIFYQRGAGPLFDIGPYYLTALVMLLGPARRVTASGRVTHERRKITSKPRAGEWMDVEVPTHVATLVDFVSGPVATLVTSFDVQASRCRNIEIYGSEGTLSVPDPNTFGGPVQIRRSYRDAWEDVPLSHGNAEQSRGLGLADLLVGLANGRPHRASGELALHVLDLMESALRASETGAHVTLSTACERPSPLPPGLGDDQFDG
jgi:predicted dehydrogenase